MIDTRKQRLLDLAAFCAGIVPTDIGHYPTEQDGIELAKDLRLLAAKVDLVIEAYGEYADSCIGQIDEDLFKDQLIGALDGNLLYAIEDGALECGRMERAR